MSRKPSEGIGKRLARFRKLAGLSARELAELAGCGLTRGVIANIETGRKVDITVDQLIALSAALAIPPVVLAIPVDEPYRFVRLTDGRKSRYLMRSVAAMDWFMGTHVLFPNFRRDERDSSEAAPPNEATAAAEILIHTVGDHPKDVRNLAAVRKMLKQGNTTEENVHGFEMELRETERTARQLGVDLQQFKVDE